MKNFFTLLLLCGLTAAAPALDFNLNTGGGVCLGGHFTRYSLSSTGPVSSIDAEQKNNKFNAGFFAFFDAALVEFSTGVHTGIFSYFEADRISSAGVQGEKNTHSGTGQEVMLDLVLLGKYPFTLNDRLSLFPLAGMAYQVCLVQNRDGRSRTYELDVDGNYYTLSFWNAMFINLGAGVDFDLSSSLFLRTELIYEIRMKTRYEKDALEEVERTVDAASTRLSGLSSGPILRVAAGWRIRK